ncbi:GDSL-type esterase/lipase family protein [Tessaracoccus sp. MC1756]|uniref:GDSL-type esterase/lipase family protein n=1 Tax=Tessaracoccus sp. MC1756 TaxID=2760311 RepID=UPI001601808A|nr:GDSL-type esterase/lipase family protein [Tessaracoccus sp. MC1756]MBB1508725.1 exo-alpha-sialidase [Tessaracoccus sp. MC1756]
MVKQSSVRRAPLTRYATSLFLGLALILGLTPGQAATAAQLPTTTAGWKQLNVSLPDHQDLEQRLAQAEPMRWLFTGDSITHGIVHTNGYKRYTEYFDQYLRTTPVNGHDRSQDVVLNTAVSSGRTICPAGDPSQPCLDLNFDSWVTDRQADVVMIALAMNDGRQNAPLVPLDQFRAELKRAVAAIRTAGGIPVLQTQNGTQNAQMNTNLEIYFTAVRELAVEDDVLMVDVATYWREISQGGLSHPAIMNDEIHPNEHGHLRWARVALDSLGLLDPASELATSGDVVSVPRTGPEIDETYTLASQGERGSEAPGVVEWNVATTFNGTTALNYGGDISAFAASSNGKVNIRFRTSATFASGQTMVLAGLAGPDGKRLEVTLFNNRVRIGRDFGSGYNWHTGARTVNDGQWHVLSVNFSANALSWTIDGTTDLNGPLSSPNELNPDRFALTTLTAGATGVTTLPRWYYAGEIDYIDLIPANQTAAALLKPLYPNSEATMWSFLGGATTAGVTEPIFAKNYVQALEEVLRGDMAANIRNRMRYVSNAALDALTSADLLERYTAEVVPQNPDAVFVAPDVTAAEAPVAEFTANVDAVIDAILADGAVAVVMTPAQLDAAAAPYAESLRTLAARDGVGLLDAHRWAAQQNAARPAIADQWFTDGTLNYKGQLSLAKFVLTQIELVPGSSRIWALDYDGGTQPQMPARGMGEFATVALQSPDKEFSNYRIPGIIQLPNGDILASYDGRPGGGDSPNPNSIVQRRSTDGGKTWGEMTYIARGSHRGTSNQGAWRFGYSDPSYLYDAETDTLFNFHVYSKNQGVFGSVVGNNDGDRNVISAAVAVSKDNGHTWVQRSLTEVVKPANVLGQFATSGHGIQITRGEYAGRLVQQYASRNTDLQIYAYSIYSDDNGQTWQRGEMIGVNMDENKVVELSDGTLMMNSRYNGGANARWVAYSHDGGHTWTERVLDETLLDPRNNASIIRMHPDAEAGSDRAKELLLSNARATSRTNGTIWYSYDEGKTWPVAKTFRTDTMMYSDLLALQDGTFGVLFEPQDAHISYGAFDEAWLNPFKAGFQETVAKGQAGQSVKVPVTVRNDDTRTLPAGSALLRLRNGWVSPEVATPAVAPGASITVELTLAIPAGSPDASHVGDVELKAGTFDLRGDARIQVGADPKLGATITGAANAAYQSRNLATNPYTVGARVGFDFTVQSTGNVTQRIEPISGPFTPFVQADGAGNCRYSALPAGGSYVCTTSAHVVTAEDIARGYFDPATVWEVHPASGTVLPKLTINVPGSLVNVIDRKPAIAGTRTLTFVDSDADGVASVGDQVAFRDVIANTGNVDLTSVTGAATADKLARGAQLTTNGSHTLTTTDVAALTAADGAFTLSGTVAAANGDRNVSNTFSGTITLPLEDAPDPSPSPSASPTPSVSPSVSPSPSPSPSVKPSVKPTVTPSGKPTTTPASDKYVPTVPYTLPGKHLFNGREWFTQCESYSQTQRCRTEIWATVVKVENGQFVRESGWAFNNLTYLPYMTRQAWKGNPLGDLDSTTNGVFTSAGRHWKTECDTPATGRGACRSYTWTTVYAATAKPAGGYTFSQSNQWVFNNIVMFGGPERRQ